MLASLSVDEILLPHYVNFSDNFRDLPHKEESIPSFKKYSFIFVREKTNASCCSFQAMQ